MKDSLTVRGRLRIVLTNKDGQVVDQREFNNLVVDAGKNLIASRLVGITDDVMSHMAVGSGTTTPAASDVALETELDRVALDSSIASDNDIAYVATYGPSVATGSLSEAGLLNADVGGTMLCRTTFPVVSKGETDTLTVSWTVTVG